MYTPTVRGGRKMSVGMLCLGRHWNALTYQYERRRTDFDNLPVPPIPPEFADLAAAAAAQAGFAMRPDLCIMNFYSTDSRMGVHQDKDESPRVDRARRAHRVRVARRCRAVRGRRPDRGRSRCSPLILRSGDVVVMGGPSRLRFHGVTRILPGTAPEGTGPGRFNLTFREW